jgi:LuxR family maltose regulon positive regulatory protein
MEPSLPGIIEAKINIPPPRSGLVPRTRILDGLTDTEASVVLVQAPAGFGKSTVLEQWAHLGARRFAWIALDPSESDLIVFWRHVYAALQVCMPGFASHLYDEVSRPQPDLSGSIIPGLLNELATIEDPLVVVLDDYHRIHSSEVDRSVQLFLRHLPRGTTLAIGTRSRPGFEVAWLRSRGLVHEVGASELSLTFDDTSSVLRSRNPDRTDEEVRWIHNTTEGWPAGVYLFGLVKSIDQSVRTTSDIRDYLMTEMLSSLSTEDAQFMQRTSILSHLEARFCDHVTQTAAAQSRLERLANSSLLVLPLDETGDRFRYHHLLQTELESLLKRNEPPDVVASHHRRAMEWTTQQGEITEAIQHAVNAGDTQAAVRLVVANWYPYIMSGRVRSAYQWLGNFTEDDPRLNPQLALSAAMISAFAGHSRDARAFAAIAEAASPEAEGFVGAQSYESSVAIMRAGIAADGPLSALADARRAAEVEPLGSPYRPLLAAMIGTFIYSTAVQDADAYPLLLEGAKAATGPPETAAYALANLALMHSWRNDEEPALNYAHQAIQRIDETRVGGFMVYGLPYAIAAKCSVESAGLAECRRLLRRAEQAERGASNAAPFDSMVLRTTMAEACLAMEDFGLAKTYAERTLGNLAVMSEGGLVANRLDHVIRMINRTEPHVEQADRPGPLLSPREVQVLSLFTTDETLAGIGRRLFISRNTVKTHATRIYRKLGVSDRQRAVAAARRLGLL